MPVQRIPRTGTRSFQEARLNHDWNRKRIRIPSTDPESADQNASNRTVQNLLVLAPIRLGESDLPSPFLNGTSMIFMIPIPLTRTR